MGRTGYNEQGLNAQKKRERVSAALLFIAVPLTLFITFRFLGSAKFMVAGLLIVVYAMIPFFMIFERRKPKAREIVLVAMMTALTVTAHLLFHVTIPIEIGTAMVIISGISLGPEAGFLVGALARFVCISIRAPAHIRHGRCSAGGSWVSLRDWRSTRWKRSICGCSHKRRQTRARLL